MKAINIFLLSIVLLSCKKEGPDGPAGPEGPAGNPGPSGGGAGIVRAFSFQPGYDFVWEEDQFVRGYFSLSFSNSGSANRKALYIPDFTEISTGALLIYFKVQNGAEDPVWYLLPKSTNLTLYMNYVHSNDQANMTSIRIQASVKQSGTALTRPEFTVSAVRAVVIPAGNVVGNQAVPADKTFSDLKQLMHTYNLKESDFRSLR